MRFLLLFCLFFFSHPGFTQDEDQLIEEINRNKQKQIDAITKIDKTTTKVKDGVFNSTESLRKLGHTAINLGALSDPKAVAIIQRSFKESHLQKLSEEEVRKLIIERSKGRVYETIFNNYPWVLDTVVEVLRDKEAMSSLIGILLKQTELKIYLAIWVVLMVLGWLFKKIFFNKNWGRWRWNFTNLFVSIFITMVSVMTFYKIFHSELTPTLSIISKHWSKIS